MASTKEVSEFLSVYTGLSSEKSTERRVSVVLQILFLLRYKKSAEKVCSLLQVSSVVSYVSNCSAGQQQSRGTVVSWDALFAVVQVRRIVDRRDSVVVEVRVQ